MSHEVVNSRLTILQRWISSSIPSNEQWLLELQNVRQVVCREVAFFKNPLIDDCLKRKRLNLLFVKDLLDGVNGMVLDHKDRRDQEINEKVEGWKKVCASVFLCLVSIGMLFYIYLFAMRQSASRQHAWFNSFVLWLFFEIFISSTGLVLVEHVLIPLWSLKDIHRVKDKIVSDLLLFQCQVKDSKDHQRRDLVRVRRQGGEEGGGGTSSDVESHEEEKTNDLFNAAEFLYPSYRVAQLFPHFAESELILQFKTPWPKNSLQHSTTSIKSSSDSRFEFISSIFGATLLFVLKIFLIFPPPLRDLIVHMTITLVGGSVVMFLSALYQQSFLSFLIAIIGMIVLIPGMFIYISRKPFRLSSNDLSPSQSTPQDHHKVKPSSGEVRLLSPHQFLTSNDEQLPNSSSSRPNPSINEDNPLLGLEDQEEDDEGLSESDSEFDFNDYFSFDEISDILSLEYWKFNSSKSDQSSAHSAKSQDSRDWKSSEDPLASVA
jgi:hypothetical protein